MVAEPVRPHEIDAEQRIFLKKYRNWRRFHRGPRQRPAALLKMLPSYADAVLVAGCQRSGTTMLTRVIANSRGFRPLSLTHDDELDAALALAGYVDLPRATRYCFQTTYLNERYPEYAMLGPGQRLIWMLRNPYSVIRSMVHNWKRWALDELFESSEARARERLGAIDLPRPGPFGHSRIFKACMAYVGKTSQVLSIRQSIAQEILMVIDYDDIVSNRVEQMRDIGAFIGQRFEPGVDSGIRADSLRKADRLTPADRLLIERIAAPTYAECLRLRSSPPAD